MKNILLIISICLITIGLQAQNSYPLYGNVSIKKDAPGTYRAYDVLNTNGRLVSRFESTTDDSGQLGLRDSSGVTKVELKSNNLPSYILGNLGVGTKTPNSKLDVNGNIQISNASLPMGLNTETYNNGSMLNMDVNFRTPNKDNQNTGAAFRIDARPEYPLFQWLYREKGSNNESLPMVLTRNGKLGIGTTDPLRKLQVGNGTSYSAYGKLNGAFVTDYTRHGKLEFNDQNFGIGAGRITDNEPYDDDLYLWSYNGEGRDISFLSTENGDTDPSTWNHNMIIKGTNGNVGIGTKTPNSKLDINGNIQISNASLPMGLNTETYNNGSMLNLDVNFRTPNKDNKNTGAAFRVDARPEYPLFQWLYREKGSNSESLPMVLTRDGNLGIGTTTPDMKLTVNGSIHSKGILVDLNIAAPDYVFAKNYDLKTIEEVELFIKKNSHLPEIPSAKELETNGILLAEMDMSLLKKIEELTLYTIEQEKKIKNLQSLNEKLIELQSRLEKIESKR